MSVKELTEHLAHLDELMTLDLVKRELELGAKPLAILQALREGIILVGNGFEKGDYFLPDLIMAGEIFREAAEILHPALGESRPKSKGNIVFGTVQGDIHDIGKDIVITILRAAGYDVHDLGVDVEPQRFVDKLRETGAAVLALSGLISTAYDSMKETVAALVNAGLRQRVKVIIGGGIMNKSVQDYTGADAYGNDPTQALRLCQKFIGGN